MSDPEWTPVPIPETRSKYAALEQALLDAHANGQALRVTLNHVKTDSMRYSLTQWANRHGYSFRSRRIGTDTMILWLTPRVEAPATSVNVDVRED